MTKTEKQHLSRVAALGCIACYLQGTPGTPAEIHHPRAGRGKGQRASHMDGIPLCPPHHRGTHHPAVPSIHLAKLAFIEQFGTEEKLLQLVQQLTGQEQAA
jgi:hypothetical protein